MGAVIYHQLLEKDSVKKRHPSKSAVYTYVTAEKFNKLKVFFENHDPTQGNRQGNDRGSQYRSTIYTYTEDQDINAQEAISRYEIAYGKTITTELKAAPIYYPAEDYHQQYLAKNPNGYCGIGGTGVTCPVGLAVT